MNSVGAGHQDVCRFGTEWWSRGVARVSGLVGPEPMVSPDGRRMAYCSARTGDRELWVRDLETEDEVQATNQAAIDLVSSWSSDVSSYFPGREIGDLWMMERTD